MRLHIRVLNQASAGFSLVELLLAVSIGGLISAVAADAMLTHLRANERLEATERLRADWSRTVHFIESEVALSERVITAKTSGGGIGISLNQCGTTIDPSTEFRFALEIRRDLPPAIYYVRANPSSDPNGNLEWHKDQSSLWRCGPIINQEGNYSNEISGNASYTVSNQRLVDGLIEATESTAACSLTTSTTSSGVSKTLQFNLCLQGIASKGYTQAATTHSRISPVFTYPTLTSLCSNENLTIEGFYKLSGGTPDAELLEVPQGAVEADQDVLICGYGGGDTINGSTANDVLEGGEKDPETSGSIISGLTGNDRLRGSRAGDTLIGGDGNDVLIGWDGDDRLVGDAGKNDYLPGLGNDTIVGGDGLDVIFFDQVRSHYTINSCNRSSCTVTHTDDDITYTVTATGAEILIFRDGREDLSAPASP